MAKRTKELKLSVPVTTVIEDHGPTPMTLIEMGVSKGLPIDNLERLMQMQERWEQNMAKKEFFKSMSGLQADMPELKKSKRVLYKTKEGGTVDYSFTPLGSIGKQLQPLLKKFGFSWMWEYGENEKGEVLVTCIVTHTDGHQIRNTAKGPKDKSGNKSEMHSGGSAYTYLERYSLKGAFGLTTTEDDIDGRGVQDKKETGEPIATRDKPFMNPNQIQNTKIHIQAGQMTMKKIKEHFTLTADQESQFKALIDSIN